MEERIQRHDDALPYKNKTSTTITPTAPSVTVIETPLRHAGLCGYVIGPGAMFCDRPVVAGSSYCAWHARCAVAPEFFDESDDERLAGLDLPAPAIAHDE